MQQSLYTHLPSVDCLLQTQDVQALTHISGTRLVKAAINQLLSEARQHIKTTATLPPWLDSTAATTTALSHAIEQLNGLGITPVYNLTGTILHTNLGRARQSPKAVKAVCAVMTQACTLEYDLKKGTRGHRDCAIEDLLKKITGAEAACIVNNNAAAVFLMLNVLAKDKEVIVSRGELVEIGGAFRMPEIMASAGARLKEVGATNRTHLKDYATNINEHTALIMKVHPSNYTITGFSKSIAEKSLVELAHSHNLPCISDLGAGALVDLSQYALPKELMVQTLIEEGIDLVSFSGDKLLGGPQAGIIVGRKKYIEQLQNHPLKRILRCDKMTIAALEATLHDYLYSDDLTQALPYLNLMTQSLETLHNTAQKTLTAFPTHVTKKYQLDICQTTCQIGSGALPNESIASIAIKITTLASTQSLYSLEKALRALSIPIIGRIQNNALWLDMRMVGDFNAFKTSLSTLNL